MDFYSWICFGWGYENLYWNLGIIYCTGKSIAPLSYYPWLQLFYNCKFLLHLLRFCFKAFSLHCSPEILRAWPGFFMVFSFFVFEKWILSHQNPHFFFPYSWSSLFFHFPSISNPKLHPPNSQSGAAGPLPELVLAWSNTTVSQNQFIICLTSCSSDLTDGYFFQSFGIRWLLCWGWMVEKRISLEGKHWTLGGETWALWWCLDVLDWWWTWILWVSSSRYLNLSWRCMIM